jgi:hypothetical protein
MRTSSANRDLVTGLSFEQALPLVDRLAPIDQTGGVDKTKEIGEFAVAVYGLIPVRRSRFAASMVFAGTLGQIESSSSAFFLFQAAMLG